MLVEHSEGEELTFKGAAGGSWGSLVELSASWLLW